MLRKRLIAGALCMAICTISGSTTCATGLSSDEACQITERAGSTENYVGTVDFTIREVPKAEMMGLDGYGIVSEDDVYEQLSALSATREWTSPDDMLTISNYDTAHLEQFEIPTVQTYKELSKIDDHFTVSYTTDENEFVLAQYYPEGVYTITVNTDLSFGNEVIEYSSEFDTIRIYEFRETKSLIGARCENN